MKKISLLVPIKILQTFELNCLHSLDSMCDASVEVVAVYDEIKIDDAACLKFGNITLVKNERSGRVAALNQAFTMSNGDVIKCIDIDDKIHFELIESLKITEYHGIHVHSACIADSNKAHKDVIFVFDTKKFLAPYDRFQLSLYSPPRWIWGFGRGVASQLFPLPSSIFAEDLYFALRLRRVARSLFVDKRVLYTYIQHGQNEWGGVLNFGSGLMAKRAKWLLEVIEKLIENRQFLEPLNLQNLAMHTEYFRYLISGNLGGVFSAHIPARMKIKIILVMRFPNLARWLFRFRLFALYAKSKILYFEQNNFYYKKLD